MFFLRFVSNIELLRFLSLIFEKKVSRCIKILKLTLAFTLKYSTCFFEVFPSFGAAMALNYFLKKNIYFYLEIQFLFC